MTNFIVSQTGFFLLLSFFALGAIGALILRQQNTLANLWSSSFAIIGSIWGLIFAFSSLYEEKSLVFKTSISSFPLLSFSFNIDKLSIFFIFVISLITLLCSIYGVGYVKHFYKQYAVGSLGFFYNAFIIGMLLVSSASSGLFFLIAWEIMSVASYFLVIYDHNDDKNIKAGFLYFVMTHIGTAFIVASFLLFYKFTGSFDFETIKSNLAEMPLLIKNIIFVMTIIGFGTKAGIIPFHMWLPSAHPAAPSHVSALMSGVMIKTGIYMMIRIFLDILAPVQAWWGIALLILGSVSSLLGVLYALTEHDLKRLLAYHSIENIGIIVLGLGAALTFSSLNMPELAMLGLVAALFHTLNHATFKSLLFLSAGSVIAQTHTKNIEEYGGLIKYMPQTAFFFLVGSMAISALPPFNGFFSEWLTFQSLFKGIALLDSPGKWMFMVSAGALIFSGGFALACFVKAFGAIFLARTRNPEIKDVKESTFSLQVGMGGLALLSLLFGIFAGYIASMLEKIVHGLETFRSAPSLLFVSETQRLAVEDSFSSVSAPVLFFALIAAIVIVLFTVKYLIRKHQTVKIGATWDCGADLTPRMEITATGFSRTIIMVFKGILKPSMKTKIEYNDASSRYFPKSMTVFLGIHDIYRFYLFEPLNKIVTVLSQGISRIQSGNINAYILYIFVALLIVLFSATI